MFFQERSRSHLKAPAGVKRWESPPLKPQIRLRIWVEVYLKNTRLLVRGWPLQWSAHNPGPCGPVLVLDATCTSAAYWGAPHRSSLYSCYAPFGNKWATPDKSSYTSLGWFNRSNLERIIQSCDMTTTFTAPTGYMRLWMLIALNKPIN